MSNSDSPPSHGALLTINLGAIAANWRMLRDKARPAACAAAVKADAYGLGVPHVVPALAAAGCDTFFVAHLSEGRSVRRAAAKPSIYVLNGFPPGSADAYREYNLRPVIGSRPELQEWLTAAPDLAHALHIDTGMNRLGFDVDELPQGARPSLLISHFVSSEVPDDPLNAGQIKAFEKARQKFPGVPASLANSSGIFLGLSPFYEMVRAGYALYGGNPLPGRDNPMQPVVRLTAPIIQVFEIKAGESAGYNAQWTAKRDSRLATISIGYADGFLRALSATDERPGGEALVGGVLCRFAGRVSMDLITIDVTEVPEHACGRGAEVTLIGGELTIDRVGARGRSIGYEVLTSLRLGRYARAYI